MKWLTLILLVAVPSAFPQQQEKKQVGRVLVYETGNDLQKDCLHYGATEESSSGQERDGVEYDIGYCEGFIAASIESIDLRYWNPPNGHLPQSQAVAVAKKYLADHPEKWSDSAGFLVNDAIIKAFPPTVGQ